MIIIRRERGCNDDVGDFVNDVYDVNGDINEDEKHLL